MTTEDQQLQSLYVRLEVLVNKQITNQDEIDGYVKELAECEAEIARLKAELERAAVPPPPIVHQVEERIEYARSNGDKVRDFLRNNTNIASVSTTVNPCTGQVTNDVQTRQSPGGTKFMVGFSFATDLGGGGGPAHSHGYGGGNRGQPGCSLM